MNEQDYALGWDDEAVAEAPLENVLLPAGDYTFRVEKLERAQYVPKPGAKLPAAPMAKITICIDSEQGKTFITENIILVKSMQWKRDSFFISIGQAVEGQPYRPNWQQVIGATGTCTVEINNYKDSHGNDRQNNKVKVFKAPTGVTGQQQTTYQQPSYQQPTGQSTGQTPPVQPQQGGFTQGQF